MAPHSWPSTAAPQSSDTRAVKSYTAVHDDAASNHVAFPSCKTASDDDDALDAPNDHIAFLPWKTASFYPSYLPREENEEGVATAEASKVEDQGVVSSELKAGAQNCSDLAQMQAFMEGHGAGQMSSGYPLLTVQPMVQAVVVQAPNMPWLMQWQPAPAPMAAAAIVTPMPFQGVARPSMGNTTVMWRNIPNNYSRDDLLELINSEGFAGSYDFFYAPTDFSSNSLVGYAFINFVCMEEADRFFHHFQGFNRWTLMSVKVSEVTWSQPLQGLSGHIERYRNSPVMHPDVPDEVRPVLLQNGQKVTFPPPTKKLRAPHLKDCRSRV